ncbi:MAG: BrnT family toxin [Acidobacteriota bacterium]
MSELRFAWDPRKAEANLRKHGVSFEEASTAFGDELGIVARDPKHSAGEERFILIGLSYGWRLLVVCHCYRESEDLIRIISARRAAPIERRQYEERLE